MIEVSDYYTGVAITHTKFQFPGGELQVKFDSDFTPVNAVLIQWQYQSDAELMEVALVKDALHNLNQQVVFLDMPYLPYARQDRVCNPGEAFALRAFASLISAMEFDLITCSDPHNHQVFYNLFYPDNTVDVKEQSACCLATLGDQFEANTFDCILFPDQGSLQKLQQYEDIIDDYDLRVACGSKKRDPATGVLTGFDIDVKDFEGASVLVVDDICDGGGTFLGLGAVAKDRNCGKLSLFTTHGIYSKGMDALNEMFDGGVYCYNNMSSYTVNS